MAQFVKIVKYTYKEGGQFFPNTEVHRKFRVPKPNGSGWQLVASTYLRYAEGWRRHTIALHSFVDTRGFRWDCIKGWTGLAK